MAKVSKRSSASSSFHDKNMSRPYHRDMAPQTQNVTPRSCRSCHQRKVRCDRGVPCTNCSRTGAACVYPTRHTAVERKEISLRNLSTRLERLENLLSGSVESSQVDAWSTAGRSGGEAPAQIQVQSSVIANAHRTARQQLPNGSVWELLLNEEGYVRHRDNSNLETLPQDVSLDFDSS
jgi:hypothetical protein